MSSYEMRNGDYVLVSESGNLRDSMSEVAIVLVSYDGGEEIMLHKHGSGKQVGLWYQMNQDKKPPNAEFIIISGKIPVGELNKLISNSTYAPKFYKKVMDGVMSIEGTK